MSFNSIVPQIACFIASQNLHRTLMKGYKMKPSYSMPIKNNNPDQNISSGNQTIIPDSNQSMIFIRNNIEYLVQWEERGYSYAMVMIYINKPKKSFTGKIKTNWIKVWEDSDTILHCSAKEMLPDKMVEWFSKCLNNYEQYTNKWNGFNNNK